MTQYKNHVALKGLDEARAHQRGEPVGRAIVTKPPRVRTTPAGRKPRFDLEQQREIAARIGPIDSLAQEYDCKPHHISAIRTRHKKGLL